MLVAEQALVELEAAGEQLEGAVDVAELELDRGEVAEVGALGEGAALVEAIDQHVDAARPDQALGVAGREVADQVGEAQGGGEGEVVVAERQSGETSLRRLDAARLASWLEDYSLSELFDKNILGGRPHFDALGSLAGATP